MSHLAAHGSGEEVIIPVGVHPFLRQPDPRGRAEIGRSGIGSDVPACTADGVMSGTANGARWVTT